MNPNLCRVVLRPRDPLEVFDLTWRLLRQRPWPFARLAAALYLPVWLVAVPVGWWFGWHWGVAVAVWAAGIVLRAPFTLLGGRLLFDEGVRARDVLREQVARVGAVAAALAVTLGGALAVSATCGLAWPFIGFVLLFLPETTLLERVPIGRAIRRSGRLAASGGLQAAAGLAGSVFLPLWFVALSEAVGQAVIGFLFQLGQPLGALSAGDATPFVLAGLLVVQPLIAVYRLLLYVDVRTRTEGWDLQVALRALGMAS